MNRKLSLLTLLACYALSAHATFYPVALTGFNQDVVANGVGNASASTSADVDGVNWAFVAPDFKAVAGNSAPAAALPSTGLVNSVATAGVSYQLESYSSNNSLQLSSTASPGTLTFTTGYMGDLYVLGTSGSGDATVDITVKFTDNTSQTFTGINFPDWYGGSGYAIQGIGRIDRTNNTLENPSGDPRLYERKLIMNPANYEKVISSVVFSRTGGKGVLNVMGITVCQVPTVSAQPVARFICETEDATFSVTAANVAGYKWQVNTGAGFVNIVNNSVYSGAGTPTLTLNDVPAAYHNNQYRCEMVSACGATVTSQLRMLSVTPAVGILTQPTSDTACVNSYSTISITNAGSAINYQWQISSTSGTFADLPNTYPYSGANAPDLNIAFADDTMNGKIFRCVVDGACNSATSGPIQFVVLPSPSFSNQPADVKVKAMRPAVFTVAASGNNFDMYWQASTDGVNFVNIVDNALYSGTKTNTLTVKNVLPSNDGNSFRCILKSNLASCNSFRDTSDIAKIIIDIPTGVNNVTAANELQLFPNPAGNVLNIVAGNGYDVVRVYDLQGRVVIEEAYNGQQLSVAKLPAGMYAVMLTGKEGRQVRGQFVKQ